MRSALLEGWGAGFRTFDGVGEMAEGQPREASLMVSCPLVFAGQKSLCFLSGLF